MNATPARMRQWLVNPADALAGEIAVPGDKSISHRALMFGGIANGLTRIGGFLESEDCRATLAALQSLGVRIERSGDGEVLVHGAGPDGLHPASGPLDMGNAGTAMRLFMGLLAGRRFDSTLVGDASLTRRPMERVAAPLRRMGARIETREGRPPVVVRASGSLRAIDFQMPVASAQVKSAVLLAALQAQGISRVVEPAVTRDHTERMLRAFGVAVGRDGAAVTLAGGQALRGTRVDVPGDFSSAAFFLVAAAIASGDGLTLRSVGMNPTRTGLLQILSAMGADIHVQPVAAAGDEPRADLRVRPSALRGITVPPHLVPLSIDELPVLFIAAACAEGVTDLSGAEELRVKESDRLAVMAEGLAALGVRHELKPDGIRIWGRPRADGPAFGGGSVASHGDHRIAMSFAVASLRAAGPIHVLDTANVATSFPPFVALARAVGIHLEEHDADAGET